MAKITRKALDTKINEVCKAMNGELETITLHTVGRDWYKMNVNMFEVPDTDKIDIVQFTYAYELYAMPNYMILDDFINKSVQDIVDEMEI